MIRKILRHLQPRTPGLGWYPNISGNLLEVRSFTHLKTAMGWLENPRILGGEFLEYRGLEDLNDRRLHDAEVLAGACRNGKPRVLLEIGTAHGRGTALMAHNAPEATVYTVNIPPEEIKSGGRKVTFAPSRAEIGSYYRGLNLSNIVQILANTADFTPSFGPIDVAFIDGCHDSDFVYSDTILVLRNCSPGCLILWHDFNPRLAPVYDWIAEVCWGVEKLYEDRRITGRIMLLQDSWTGLYRVPPE